MARVVETATGGLNVGLPSLGVGSVMVDDGVQAGKAGTGGEENRQQEERLGLDQSRGHEKSIANLSS